MAANPHIRDGVKAGEIITIPATCDVTQVQIEETYPDELVTPPSHDEAATAPERVPWTELTPAIPATADSDQADPDEDDAMVNIAVMLPFQLNRERPNKQAMHYTDFYKGLLMAVDTMRTCGAPIHVYAYDTCDNADSVASILANRPEMAEMDMIIAPDDTAHIEMIAQHADTVAATVINMFAVRDNSHLRHSSVFQGNIPHEMMYAKAIDSFINLFDGYTPVILNQSDDPKGCDKTIFVNALTSRLDHDSIPYRTVDYTGTMSDSDIAWMAPGVRYVVIPTSSSRSALNAILPALAEKRSGIDASRRCASVWLPRMDHPARRPAKETSRDEHHHIFTVRDGCRQLPYTQSREPVPAVVRHSHDPDCTHAGYTRLQNTGMVAILTALGKDSGHKGLQSGFEPVPVGDGEQGWINNSLYFIHFLPTGTIERTSL